MIIRPICKFIQDKTSFTLGRDLFCEHRPQDAPDRCVLINESPSSTVDSDLPDRIDEVVQVTTRAKIQSQAREDAWEVYRSIYMNYGQGSAGWALPVIVAGEKFTAMVIIPIAPPQYIGQDDKLRYEYSTNYIFKIKDTDL